MSRRTLFALSAVAALMLLGATPAVAGEASAVPPATQIDQAPAGCGAALAAPLAPANPVNTGPNLCAAPAPRPASEAPAFLAPSKRRGYCHCGCVNQRVCRTSDDCGGASCDQFISCC